MSPITLWFSSMTGLWIFCILELYCVSSFFSSFNTISLQRRVYVCVFLVAHKHLWLLINFVWPHSLSLNRDYVLRHLVLWFWFRNDVFFYTWHQILFICLVENLQGIPVSVIFQSSHLTYLVTTTLLVSGLYNLYVSLIWLSIYPTMIALDCLSDIFFLNFYCLVM